MYQTLIPTVGKADVIKCYENYSKIASPGSKTYAVGTRYSNDDLYAHLQKECISYVDEDTEEEVVEYLWGVFTRVVEDSPNRTGDGNFIWPRKKFEDGSAYGFDRRELSIKKAKQSQTGNLTGFYAQYYNDPNDKSLNKLNRANFKYFEAKHLREENGVWHYRNKKLSIHCAADLAFTEGHGRLLKRRDHTAICVIGYDDEGYVYVLDIDRFQTDKTEVYYEHIMEIHRKWNFRKIVIETNNGGKLVKTYVEDMIRRDGGMLEVEGKAHTSHDGKKEERIMQALEPRYRAGTIYHAKSGVIDLLEKELIENKPSHRDLKDALAIAIETSKPPRAKKGNPLATQRRGNITPISRYGGKRGARAWR